MNMINYFIATLSFFIGIGSIITFTVFLYIGPFHVLKLSLTDNELLLFDMILSILFFLQHSLMVRNWFKAWMIQFIPMNYFVAMFSIASGISLFVLMTLWQESSWIIIKCESSCYWLVRVVFFTTLSLQGWALWSLKETDLFGINTLINPPMQQSMKTESILMIGAYKWVRHPIYTTSILLLWLYPILTADRLLMNVLFTLWIIIGTKLEERDLVTKYGDAYKKYQSIVPMLIPRFNGIYSGHYKDT